MLLAAAIALAGCGAAGNARFQADGPPAQAEGAQIQADGAPARTADAAPGALDMETGAIPGVRGIEAQACEDPAMAEAAMAIIDGVVSRFPPGLSECAGIDAVYICEGLTSHGVPVPAASARIEGRTCVYVDAGAPRRIDVSFTHELFHAIEFGHPVDEGAWARINPYESYLRDTAQPGETVRYSPNTAPAFEPGFVSDYARFSAAEDRAELFSALYSGRGLSVKERAAMRSDPFLMEKIAFLKGYLDIAGLDTGGMRDNLFSVETRCFCNAYTLAKPGLAMTGPTGAYPAANLEAGQLLAGSGIEKDGVRMLYCAGNGNDGDRMLFGAGLSRVYAPQEALEPAEGVTIEIALPPLR